MCQEVGRHGTEVQVWILELIGKGRFEKLGCQWQLGIGEEGCRVGCPEDPRRPH